MADPTVLRLLAAGVGGGAFALLFCEVGYHAGTGHFTRGAVLVPVLAALCLALVVAAVRVGG